MPVRPDLVLPSLRNRYALTRWVLWRSLSVGVQMVWRESSGWPSDEIAGLAFGYAGLVHLIRVLQTKTFVILFVLLTWLVPCLPSILQLAPALAR